MLNRVVIVGGGIAGSALAIALARRNVPVTLIEREKRWTPASSGIFIYCNGLMALDQLGEGLAKVTILAQQGAAAPAGGPRRARARGGWGPPAGSPVPGAAHRPVR